MAKADEGTVYVKKSGDRVLKRTVYTASERTTATFDGYVPEKKAQPAADKPAAAPRPSARAAISAEATASNAGA